MTKFLAKKKITQIIIITLIICKLKVPKKYQY